MQHRQRMRVAVIGGGPSGAHCAYRMADVGLDVTLFEHRTRFEKPCGGGLPARGLEAFPYLVDPRLPMKSVHRCSVVAPSGREVEISLHDPIYIFSRADLHRFMLDRAIERSVTLDRARVLSLSRIPSGSLRGDGVGCTQWLLRVTGESATREAGPFDFLVAADGATGTARRQLVGALSAAELTQGIGYYIPGLSEERVVLKFFQQVEGYLWVFPRPGHSSAGICAPLGARPAAELWRLMDRFIAGRFGERTLSRSERYAALIPAPPRSPSDTRCAPSIMGNGWALIGDSAGSVDPLTQEGIYYGMLTGEILADCVARGRPGRYPEICFERFGRELGLARRMSRRFFDPSFTERLVMLSGLSPRIARILSDLVAGRQSYRTLKRRLVLNAPLVGLQSVTSLVTGRHGEHGGADRAPTTVRGS